ncbi:MAG TPA: glutamine--fructose-6-phosphate transaminase (isomerizing), partial [Gammaproteobacteria bacterium]|nr:glutamine--fructose-6-phosphate transaminase (isomerizing) [Gammaproteobacteria bacterium]
MCGIVGAIAERNVVAVLVEGLHRLEYRGYDSAGVVVAQPNHELGLVRTTGKVAELEQKLRAHPLTGHLGIAHTRWATHGGVTEANAHPHVSRGRVAVIHNGIIENFQEIKDELVEAGYEFQSETDTEVAAHLIHSLLGQGHGLVEAVRLAVRRFSGAYALLVIDAEDPQRIVASRIASPLVIGLGLGENFVASGVPALLPVTQRFVYLEEGDLAEITRDKVTVFDATGREVSRETHEAQYSSDTVDKGPYRHFMLKEIFDQPAALTDTLYGRIANDRVVPESLGPRSADMLAKVQHVHVVACGTSYHAGMVGRYWLELLAGVPCQVEIASEYRYRRVVVPANTLFVTLSQSGETADTLEALRMARRSGYLGTLTICNSAHSSMVRESDLVMMTHAGPEIGVASTKAFTTQLLSMLLVTLMLARC